MTEQSFSEKVIAVLSPTVAGQLVRRGLFTRRVSSQEHAGIRVYAVGADPAKVAVNLSSL